MGNLISVSELTAKSASDVIMEYASKLPDGKAVLINDVVTDLAMPKPTVDRTARQLRVAITAFTQDGNTTRKLTYIANPKTAKAWHQAQNK